MSFGFGIGDVLAVAGAIERIIGEVKSYREAPIHFRRLAIELDFLGQVCNQVFTLQPTLPDERAHIERIRAISMQCLGPLRSFEEKMRSYHNTFGIQANHNSTASTSWTIIKWRGRKPKAAQRLHWSAIARHEVDELRAILTSEILAINAILTMNNWTSLKNQGLVEELHTQQLKQLVDTTNEASNEIRTYLVESKIASERLQQIIGTMDLTRSEHIRIIQAVEGLSSKTCDISEGLLEQKIQIADTQDSINALSMTFGSLQRYMEGWVEAIVDQCQHLLDTVQRNTQILLSMNGLLCRLEMLLTTSKVDFPSIVFEDAFGVKMLLPFQLCNSWDAFSRLLGNIFYDKPGSQLVAKGRFLVMRSSTNRTIAPQAWSSCVAAGDQLTMSIVLERFNCRVCPRCRSILPNGASQAAAFGTTCLQCDLWFSFAASSNSPSNVSQNDHELFMPVPPTEMIHLQGSDTSTPIEWDARVIGDQSSMIKMTASDGLKTDPGPAASPQDDGNASELDGIELFRRIHILPYAGDDLGALIEISQEVRTLLMEFSAATLADMAPFKERYRGIIADLDVLRDRNISPLVEIAKRTKHSTDSTKLALEAYILRTAQILSSAPSAIALRQSDAIIHWLTAMRAKSTVPVLGHPEKIYEGPYFAQDIYIYLADSQGRRQRYQVNIVAMGWYCVSCSHGPMSPDFDDLCNDCHRRRSRKSRVDTQTSYVRVDESGVTPLA